MDKKRLRELVLEGVEMLDIKPDIFDEAAQRSGKCLSLVALLADYKRDLRVDLTKLQALADIEYKSGIDCSENKNITAQKVDAAAYPPYQKYSKALGQIEAEISWASTMINVFEKIYNTYHHMYKENS